MKALAKLATLAAVATALAVPASAQIISTSLPTAKAGGARDKFSAHIMATPFAKWDYGEVYARCQFFGSAEECVYASLKGTPNSDVMVAGEVAFALGESNWSITAGGWYNKIGEHNFDLNGVYFDSIGDVVYANGTATAKAPFDLSMYEGHLGVFYKAVGVQGGVVKTKQKSAGDLTDIVVDGTPIIDLPGYGGDIDVTTTDWTVFGVVRKSAPRWGVSVGAGAYFKQGISEGSPLRFGDDAVVFSGFVTGTVNVFKGLGVDVSYWYVGKTEASSEFNDILAELGASPTSDAQSRFTIGIGYSF